MLLYVWEWTEIVKGVHSTQMLISIIQISQEANLHNCCYHLNMGFLDLHRFLYILYADINIWGYFFYLCFPSKPLSHKAGINRLYNVIKVTIWASMALYRCYLKLFVWQLLGNTFRLQHKADRCRYILYILTSRKNASSKNKREYLLDWSD